MKTITEAPAAGDLLWIDLSPTVGTEQHGRRPVLVLSGQDYNTRSGRAVVVPVTSTIKGNPFEVLMPHGEGPQGAVLVDQVRTVDWRARYAKAAGQVPQSVLEETLGKLGSLVGII